MRRIVALAILIGLVCFAVYVVNWAKGGLAEDQQVAAHKAKQEAQIEMPKDCKAGNLEISVSPEQTVYPVGGQVGLVLSLKNTGGAPCTADGSFAQLGVHIKSGDQNVYYSIPCNKDLPAKPLLLDKNQTWQDTLEWDTSTADNKCQATGKAAAGTYKLIPVQNGKEFPGRQAIVNLEGESEKAPSEGEDN